MTLNDLFANDTAREIIASKTHTVTVNGFDWEITAEAIVLKGVDGAVLNVSSFVRTSGGIYYRCVNYATAEKVAGKMAEVWATGDMAWEPSHEDCCPDNRGRSY